MSQINSNGFKRILIDVRPEFRDKVDWAMKRYGYVTIREMFQGLLEEGWTLRENMKRGDKLVIHKADGEEIQIIMPLKR